MRRNVEPHLEDIAHRLTLDLDHAPKYRLCSQGLSKDEVRGLATICWNDVLPSRDTPGTKTLHVNVRRHPVDESQAQDIRCGEQRQTGVPFEKNVMELLRGIAVKQEAHRRLPDRTRRRPRLPAA